MDWATPFALMARTPACGTKPMRNHCPCTNSDTTNWRQYFITFHVELIWASCFGMLWNSSWGRTSVRSLMRSLMRSTAFSQTGDSASAARLPTWPVTDWLGVSEAYSTGSR